MATKKVNSGRRRVPRRTFEAPVGVLISGKYHMQQAFQVGEGGMMISGTQVLRVGSQAVISFFLNSGSLIIVRGVVRSVVPAEDGLPQRFGIEFLNLGFQYKREIRNFVAAATRIDGPMAP
jgi:hypothetical protein